MTYPETGLQIRSEVRGDGTLALSLVDEPTPAPGPSQVVVRIEAAPINPSDLGLLFGGADMATAKATGVTGRPAVTATLPPAALRMMAGRVGQSLPVGNEGAGVVVAAGSSEAAQALLGQTVAVLGGAMYSQYRTLHIGQCLRLPAGVAPKQGASCFVNPLTALGMTETMRLEGHKAIVHTAAASNLGQMLVKLCKADGIGLVNVVRRPEQAELLRSIGATYVCDSSSPTFMDDLTDAVEATGATIGFDAIGGGRQGGQILAAMEAAAVRNAAEYSRYGSTVHKQLYIYGGLDRGPTEFNRAFGMAWSMGGWLLTPFLERIGPAAAQALRERVAREVTTTFASSYTAEVSLPEALSLEAIAVYGKQATGEKYLVTPHKGA
ncbi:MAG: zinc-binding dehydrogenase [Dehalococcoidia bacterium]|nr:zinc-binding dehydrogenase [Dehalococcoidia bacterium]